MLSGLALHRKPILPLTALAFAAAACGEITDDPDQGGSGGSATIGGAGVSGNAGGGAEASMTGGVGGTDSIADAGPGDAAAASAGGPNALPADCPVPAPIRAFEEQVFAIQSINFVTSEVVLKNISSTNQPIGGGRQGWQWCNYPAYWNILSTDADVMVGPGKTYTFTPIYNTMGPWALDREGGEMGIISETGGFTTADFYRAFVSWGEAETRREPTAVQARYWTYGDRIELEPGHAGFVATGRTDVASGYTSVRAACLVAPPNP